MPNKYSVNNDNRVVIANNGENLSIDGSFSTDEDNQLIYWLNETSSWRTKYQLPEKIIFTGNWKLNSNYDLELELIQNKSDWQRDILTLKGELISCESDKLVFEIKSVDKNGLTQLRLLKLTGTWAANELNQIYFSVSKKESPDILTLQGAWRLNQNQQIIYEYEKTGLKTKNKISNTLIFRGFWQISSANRLTYILKHSSDSRFDFRVQIETPTIYPQKGVIKYRLGIGIREKKGLSPKGTVPKIISLYGAWKFSRNLGLVFQMDYKKEGLVSTEFTADVTFQKNTVTFTIRNRQGDPLGIILTFTHKFLKGLDAQAFLRLKALEEESAIEAGLRIPF